MYTSNGADVRYAADSANALARVLAATIALHPRLDGNDPH
jgi:hypothetical protein